MHVDVDGAAAPASQVTGEDEHVLIGATLFDVAVAIGDVVGQFEAFRRRERRFDPCDSSLEAVRERLRRVDVARRSAAHGVVAARACVGLHGP